MPEFQKPDFTYHYRLSSQLNAIRNYRQNKPGRQVPEKSPDKLLLATWNIANLGLQDRREKDYRILAELISWFDVVALQEVNDNLEGLRALQAHLPTYRVIFSDKAGNNERLAFLYETPKVSLLEKVGEIGIPPKDQPDIKLPNIQQTFRGFDRNPYLVAFQVKNFVFVPVNVHLFFGKEKWGVVSKIDMNRRALEAYAVARWADLRRKSKHAFTRHIIPIGDFNLPKVEEDDPIYFALTKRGLLLPGHSTEMGSSVARDRHYDQILFFRQPTDEVYIQSGVFDFDGAIFSHLWDIRGRGAFNAYVRYYISDHRIMWAEFNCE